MPFLTYSVGRFTLCRVLNYHRWCQQVDVDPFSPSSRTYQEHHENWCFAVCFDSHWAFCFQFGSSGGRNVMWHRQRPDRSTGHGTLGHNSCSFTSAKTLLLDAKKMLESRRKWYSIVISRYRHAPISLPMVSGESWANLKWTITVNRSGLPIEKHRLLARMENVALSKLLYHGHFCFRSFQPAFETRLAEGRGMEGDGHNSRRGILQGHKLSFSFHQSDSVNSHEAASCGRKRNTRYCQPQEPGYYLRNITLNLFVGKAINGVLVLANCRLFSSLLLNSSLKSATIFMKGDPVNGEGSQLNTVRHCKHSIEMNNCNPVRHGAVTTHFKNAMYALQEEQKYLLYIEKERWSHELHTLAENTFRATTLHEELNKNQCNRNHDLPTTLKPYGKHFLTPAECIVSAFMQHKTKRSELKMHIMHFLAKHREKMSSAMDLQVHWVKTKIRCWKKESQQRTVHFLQNPHVSQENIFIELEILGCSFTGDVAILHPKNLGLRHSKVWCNCYRTSQRSLLHWYKGIL